MRHESDNELEMSVIMGGQNKLPLVGKILNSQTKIQIRTCLQAIKSSASGVWRSSNGQHVPAALHLCLSMTQPSRNVLNTRNCGLSSIRKYHILHVSTSSLSSDRCFIRCGYQILTSYFSLSSQTLSSSLNYSSIGISDVTLGKTSEKSVSNGELHDEVYGKHIAKGDNCGSNETFSLDSSFVQENNVDVRNGTSCKDSRETTQLNSMFNENNDGNHDIYAELYFNLMNGKNVKLQNGSLDHHDEETAQTFDSYANMYSKLTQSNEKDREESEIRLTHIDTDGKAVMVDVGDKTTTLREARAEGRIYLGPEAARLVKDNKMKKGDVLTVAQIAGITAAKQTAQLIPLCHNINLTKVDVICVLNEKCHSVDITSLVRTIGVTGVEMEALMAVSIAALTVYDMCKAVTHDMVVSDVRLVSKSGGKRGFQRQQ